jgi:DNA-binding XRE family transcriptional regulator
MDKRFKPLSPAEQMLQRQALYAELDSSPGLPLKDTIRLIRKNLRLTVADLAKLTSVSERFLHDTEAGRGNPSLATAQKVLAPFGLQLGVVSHNPR